MLAVLSMLREGSIRIVHSVNIVLLLLVECSRLGGCVVLPTLRS